MTDETVTAEAPSAPETQSVSIADYADSTAELVAKVARRHKLPPGIAFNVVAWSVQRLDGLARQAEDAAQLAAANLPTAPEEVPA